MAGKIFYFIFSCSLYHITPKVVEYCLNIGKASKNSFQVVHKGMGSKHEDCYGTCEKLVEALSSQSLIISRNFSTGPNS